MLHFKKKNIPDFELCNRMSIDFTFLVYSNNIVNITGQRSTNGLPCHFSFKTKILKLSRSLKIFDNTCK